MSWSKMVKISYSHMRVGNYIIERSVMVFSCFAFDVALRCSFSQDRFPLTKAK